MLYNIKVTEILSKSIGIEADSLEDAKIEAYHLWENQDFIVDTVSDFERVEFTQGGE